MLFAVRLLLLLLLLLFRCTFIHSLGTFSKREKKKKIGIEWFSTWFRNYCLLVFLFLDSFICLPFALFLFLFQDSCVLTLFLFLYHSVCLFTVNSFRSFNEKIIITTTKTTHNNVKCSKCIRIARTHLSVLMYDGAQTLLHQNEHLCALSLPAILCA